MIISARVSEEIGEQVKAYAFYNEVSVSALLRRALEKEMEGVELMTEEQLLYVKEQTRYNTPRSVARKKGAR